MGFDRVGFYPAEIMLPAASVAPESWACIACDQFTSEPAYWQEAEALVGDQPSALRLILPECYLAESEKRIPRIHETMAAYLVQGELECAVKNGFVLCERKLASGRRLGLIGAVDLEAYSFERTEKPLIRPTEETIRSRLPARLAIRRGAPLEMTHVMILLDDPERTVLEPLEKKKKELRPLYDFELMLGGGHLTGYAVEGEALLSQVERALNALLDQKIQQKAAEEAQPDGKQRENEKPMLLAVGDGNHSLATAKAYWEEIKATLTETEREHHPARYALCEIVNMHDEALLFEPIHRLMTGVSKEELLGAWTAYAAKKGMELERVFGDGKENRETENGSVKKENGEEDRERGKAHGFTLVSEEGEEFIFILHPEGQIPCETLQVFLDDFLGSHPEAGIDYIHGESALRSLAAAPKTVGFLLPPIDKTTFFRDVNVLGVLPRKTFSMGEAREKRYYMEAKRI